MNSIEWESKYEVSCKSHKIVGLYWEINLQFEKRNLNEYSPDMPSYVHHSSHLTLKKPAKR